eukprot:403356851
MNVTNMHNLNILIVTLLFLQQVFGNTECFVSSMNVIGCGENQQNCVGYQTTEMGVAYPLTLIMVTLELEHQNHKMFLI